ncbi:MAG: tetratricopeptide repeat protein [Gemmatimonadetes bacterium]|nr:tetratricopeptide repeat protein [Gemmatimonadota bacterium]
MASSARIDELRKKFDENPRRYFAPLANEYRKAGDLAQAIAICRQHLADQPGHMSGHIVYGQALFEHKEFTEARSVFEAALALDPENLIALRHLGDIARDEGDYPSARTWYQRVLDADPRNEDIAAQMALVAEAEANAARAAAPPPPPAAKPTPAKPLAATIVVSAVKKQGEMADARTVEIAAVPRPSHVVPAEPAPVAGEAAAAAVEPPPPAPVPETMEDVAPPRLSLMGLDLESMAGVEEAAAPPATPPLEPALGFDSGRFEGDIDVESNPLAGLSGVAQNEENTAAGLLAREPVDSGFQLGADFHHDATPEAAPAASAAELPPELQVPTRNTPPIVDLGLAPQPKVESTGLWDTPEDEASSAAAHAELELEPTFSQPPEAPAPPAALPELETVEPPDHEAAAAPPASGAFVTETMAELYVKQGFKEQAIEVYRQLLEQRPGDAGLRGKLSALQASLVMAAPATPPPATMDAAALAAVTEILPSGPTIREFFGALARWSPGHGNGAHAAPSAVEPTPSGVGYDLGLFAGAVISDADEQAARLMAQLYPEPLGVGNGGAHAAAAAPAAVAEPLPGNPARPAKSELSLDQVFTEPQPVRPSRRSSASFSFDQFFSASPGGTPPAGATPAAPQAPVRPAEQTPEEIEQFQSWLGGLKKK